MLHRLLTPNVVSRNASISACENGMLWEKAHRLLQEMRQRTLAQNMVSHSAGISLCEKGGHREEAFSLLQEILHRSLPPNVVSRNASTSARKRRQTLGGSLLPAAGNASQVDHAQRGKPQRMHQRV